MEFIEAFEPTLLSLLVVNLLPFVYFGYHASNWHNIASLKKFDFVLAALSLVLAILLIVKLLKTWSFLEQETLLLLLLHGAPLALTLLIIQGNALGTQLDKIAAKERDKDSYAPKPLNKEVAPVTWDDIIIAEDLKKEMFAVIKLLKDPSTSQKYGIAVPKGILLAGPPGTGKTSLARVIARNAGLNFFNLSMDEIVSKWVGESEKNLSKLFNAAKKHAPAVIFIDEVDSIGRSRSAGGQRWAENLLNHLLQLVDGVTETKGLYIIAATNRPDLVDDALKRPGRLNKVISVPLPDYDARLRLLELYLGKLPLADNIDLAHLAAITEGKSGADFAAICNQAGLNAFNRESSGGKKRDYTVSAEDLALAVQEFVPR